MYMYKHCYINNLICNTTYFNLYVYMHIPHYSIMHVFICIITCLSIVFIPTNHQDT
jgi:hypothetical protein